MPGIALLSFHTLSTTPQSANTVFFLVDSVITASTQRGGKDCKTASASPWYKVSAGSSKKGFMNPLDAGLSALSSGARGAQAILSVRTFRNRKPLRPHNAGGYGIRLLGGDRVSKGFQPAHPHRDKLTGKGPYSRGAVQPCGTPIIHSAKDTSTICFPDGRAARPVNPYSQPRSHAPRLVAFSQTSGERR